MLSWLGVPGDTHIRVLVTMTEAARAEQDCETPRKAGVGYDEIAENDALSQIRPALRFADRQATG